MIAAFVAGAVIAGVGILWHFKTIYDDKVAKEFTDKLSQIEKENANRAQEFRAECTKVIDEALAEARDLRDALDGANRDAGYWHDQYDALEAKLAKRAKRRKS